MKNIVPLKTTLSLLISTLTFTMTVKSDDGRTTRPAPLVIANHSEETMARISQIEKMNADENQTILAEFALNDDDVFVRRTAVRKLTDQVILAIITTNETATGIRRIAIEKLTDQTLLAELAQNDPNYTIRWTAINKLEDQELLEKIAMNDTSIDVRVGAAATLTD